jgi:hypothetical protein
VFCANFESDQLFVQISADKLGDFWKKVSLMVGRAHPTAATVACLKLGSSFLEISLGPTPKNLVG